MTSPIYLKKLIPNNMSLWIKKSKTKKSIHHRYIRRGGTQKRSRIVTPNDTQPQSDDTPLYIKNTQNFIGELSKYYDGKSIFNFDFNTFYLDSIHDKLNGFGTFGEPDDEILSNSIEFLIKGKPSFNLRLLSHEEVVNYDEKVVIFDAGLSHHPLMGLSNFLDSASTPSLTQFLKDNPQKNSQNNPITSKTIQKSFDEDKIQSSLKTKNSKTYNFMITQSD